MSADLLWHRIQFAFTITYHYLFPQLTMGLALLIVVLKVLALRTADERYNEVARFWAHIFGPWLSGYFIIVTNAFMQHPVGYTVGGMACCTWRTSGRSSSIPGR